jgi:hypothetical protein
MKVLKFQFIILIGCWIPVLFANVIFLLTGYNFEYSLYLTVLIIPYFSFMIVFTIGLMINFFEKIFKV